MIGVDPQGGLASLNALGQLAVIALHDAKAPMRFCVAGVDGKSLLRGLASQATRWLPRLLPEQPREVVAVCKPSVRIGKARL